MQRSWPAWFPMRAAAESDPDTALLLAAEARAESAAPATAGTLVDALLARPSAHTFLRAESTTVQAIALDGEAVATASGNQVQLWSQDGWQQTGGFAVGETEVVDLVFTDEGGHFSPPFQVITHSSPSMPEPGARPPIPPGTASCNPSEW